MAFSDSAKGNFSSFVFFLNKYKRSDYNINNMALITKASLSYYFINLINIKFIEN